MPTGLQRTTCMLLQILSLRIPSGMRCRVQLDGDGSRRIAAGWHVPFEVGVFHSCNFALFEAAWPCSIIVWKRSGNLTPASRICLMKAPPQIYIQASLDPFLG